MLLFRRYGTPLTLLDEGDASLESKDGEFDGEGESGLGEECGDGVYGGWIFPHKLFAVGEYKVEDDEV
jgi:hypothetical protein